MGESTALQALIRQYQRERPGLNRRNWEVMAVTEFLLTRQANRQRPSQAPRPKTPRRNSPPRPPGGRSALLRKVEGDMQRYRYKRDMDTWAEDRIMEYRLSRTEMDALIARYKRERPGLKYRDWKVMAVTELVRRKRSTSGHRRSFIERRLA